jgi:hypothetical protein
MAANSLNKALNRMRAGAALIHSHDNTRKRNWYIVPGGPVTDEVATEIIRHPNVVGQKDSLWPGLDQTFRMRSFAG